MRSRLTFKLEGTVEKTGAHRMHGMERGKDNIDLDKQIGFSGGILGRQRGVGVWSGTAAWQDWFPVTLGSCPWSVRS